MDLHIALCWICSCLPLMPGHALRARNQPQESAPQADAQQMCPACTWRKSKLDQQMCPACTWRKSKLDQQMCPACTWRKSKLGCTMHQRSSCPVSSAMSTPANSWGCRLNSSGRSVCKWLRISVCFWALPCGTALLCACSTRLLCWPKLTTALGTH